MDDEDVLWFKAFNAKEEGTSEGAIVNGSPQGKRSKGKDKERDGNGPLKMSEDEFEYVMGMLELWTDRNVPMLHTVSCFSFLFSSFSVP
jgi:enhancer of polycomb-like protein